MAPCAPSVERAKQDRLLGAASGGEIPIDDDIEVLTALGDQLSGVLARGHVGDEGDVDQGSPARRTRWRRLDDAVAGPRTAAVVIDQAIDAALARLQGFDRQALFRTPASPAIAG